MPKDSENLRNLLLQIFPDLIIDGTPPESGQRVVYYCHFSGRGLAVHPKIPWCKWGPVVLKICAGIDATTIAYMQKEIQILNEINSNYFPKLLWNDVITKDPDTDIPLPEKLFVSIETYIDSEPLNSCSHIFKEEKSAIFLLQNLISAGNVLWSHPKKLVHRDLKPANILIKKNGLPVIIDLGILREAGARGVTQTAFGGPMTIKYSSPEQINYDKQIISFKTDLFSIGTIMYEVISGEHPYDPLGTSSPMEIMQSICTTTPIPLHNLNIISPLFSSILIKMMEKLPYKRYRTIELLLKDLSNAKENIRGN